jgi:hypothetical protein
MPAPRKPSVPKKKGSDGPLIDIIPMETGKLQCFVLGTMPLIFNAVSLKAQQELLFPSPPKNANERKTTLKHEPMSEYRASVYRFRQPDAPTRLYIPATAFKSAIGTAALRTPGSTKTEIGQLCWVTGTSPDFGADKIPVWGVPQMLMSVVRNSDQARTPDIRTRAILPHWCCSFMITHVMPGLTAKVLINLLSAAGLIAGIGDFRQEKGKGSYGQFDQVLQADPTAAQIIKVGGTAAQDAALDEPAYYDIETETLYNWFLEELVKRGPDAPKKLPPELIPEDAPNEYEIDGVR